jgi:hypothetical protein
MLARRMFGTLIPFIGESSISRHVPSKLTFLVTFSPASLEPTFHWILSLERNPLHIDTN